MLASAVAAAQTIGLNQSVVANFNSAAEFTTLSSAGWIFRAGDGVGAQTCATPGNINACGFGFFQDGGVGAARGLAAGNTQGRWIITPPIVFGSSGNLRVVLRKVTSGTGGLDVRESGGGSDTQDMSENSIDQVLEAEVRGGGACPAGNSFCALRNLRSSGSATSGGEPSCATLFTLANPGVGLNYCTVQIDASELQDFGTGVHRIAIKLRSSGSTAGSNVDMLVDRIEINTGNNDVLPTQAFISHGFTGSVPGLGFYRHPKEGHTAANLTLLSTLTSSDFVALDFAPNGSTLYGIVQGSSDSTLVRVDTSNGARTVIGTVSGFLSTNEFVRGLMIDPQSGQSYVMTRSFADTQSRLYLFDLSNAEAFLQAGVNGGGAFRASASAIDCRGRLFSVETTNPAGVGGRLYRVNRTDGSVTLVGNTGYTSTLFHGPIDFDNAGERLMGWVQAQSGAYVGYGSYNLSTGLFTPISTTPQLTVGAGALSGRCWERFANGFE
jgi:hypothetical protein